MPPAGEFYSLGNEANARGDFALAATHYRKALALAPDWHEARHNFAGALYQLGQIDDAMNSFSQAAAGPNSEFSRGMMAVIVPGSQQATNESILEVRQAWGGIITPDPHPRARKPRRSRGFPIRIGYMCSLFNQENYMKPVWALINRHDRSQFEIHLFSDVRRESIQSGYRPHASDTFHYTGDLKIVACAAAIEAAEVHILIDLNAYSRWRRLPIYGLRPAPVIASWFNSYATTGMSSIDYLIGDSVVAPLDEDRYYAEKILRVSGSYLTFEVSYPVPDVALPPCFTNGHITFGCLAPLYKITPPVIQAWSKILHGASKSILFLKNTALGVSGNREFLVGLFAKQGISADRLKFEGPSGHFEFLTAYSKIDIALDTFPYNGGTTTTEALWQGVPVLTFYGDRWASRTSASILRAGGLTQFIAADFEAYVRSAINLARDSATPDMLAELRRNMRNRLAESSVCNTEAFAREMEELYRHITGLISP